MKPAAGLALLLMACAGDIKTDPRGPAEPADPGDPRDSRDPRDPRDSSVQPIVLTATAPRHDVAIPGLSGTSAPSAPSGAPPTAGAPPPAGAPPTTLTITVAAIDNPSSQAFSISAGLLASTAGTAGTAGTADARAGTAGTIEIGSITPYPADLPGQFVLALPEPTRELLSRDTRASLRLTLQPISADRPLAEPLRVTIGELTWR
jgi:hypothetical protein